MGSGAKPGMSNQGSQIFSNFLGLPWCLYASCSLIRESFMDVIHSVFVGAVVDSHFLAISFLARNSTLRMAVYVWGVYCSSSSQPNRQSLGSVIRLRFHMLLIVFITAAQYLCSFRHFHSIWISVPLSTRQRGQSVSSLLCHLCNFSGVRYLNNE